jgi:hypothetical protein
MLILEQVFELFW